MRELHPRPRWIVAQQGREPINHGNTECRAYYPGIEDSGDAVLARCRSRNLKKEKWPTSEGKNNRHDGPVGHERADADGLRFGHRAADEHRQPEEQCDHDHALAPAPRRPYLVVSVEEEDATFPACGHDDHSDHFDIEHGTIL